LLDNLCKLGYNSLVGSGVRKNYTMIDNVASVVSKDGQAALLLCLEIRQRGYPCEYFISPESNKGYKKAVSKGLNFEFCILLDESVCKDTFWNTSVEYKKENLGSLLYDALGRPTKDLPRVY
jgi:hypothetical protein